jgi:hypothetical protein
MQINGVVNNFSTPTSFNRAVKQASSNGKLVVVSDPLRKVKFKGTSLRDLKLQIEISLALTGEFSLTVTDTDAASPNIDLLGFAPIFLLKY